MEQLFNQACSVIVFPVVAILLYVVGWTHHCIIDDGNTETTDKVLFSILITAMAAGVAILSTMALAGLWIGFIKFLHLLRVLSA